MVANACSEGKECGTLVAFAHARDQSFMLTATTRTRASKNKPSQLAQVLLDTAAGKNYITKRLAETLNIDPETMINETVFVSYFGCAEAKVCHTKAFAIELQLQDKAWIPIWVNMVGNLTSTFKRNGLLASLAKVRQLAQSHPLADSIPTTPGLLDPDLLLGVPIFEYLMTDTPRIKVAPGLYLRKTRLGWMLSCHSAEYIKPCTETMLLCTGVNVKHAEPCLFIAGTIFAKPKPSTDVELLYGLEGIGITDCPIENDDDRAVEEFNNSVKFEAGRFVVKWPKKGNKIEELPENKELAFGRLRCQLSKYGTQANILARINDIIETQKNRGIIEEVYPGQKDGQVHYIPHHPVFTPLKTTTKVRLVYDASAKTKPTNLSFNECLYWGQVLLHNLSGLLLRFRLYKYAILADIEKAFLQIALHVGDRDLTKFFWIRDLTRPTTSNNNLVVYRFARVPFGVITSPFLLTATIKCHLSQENTVIAEMIQKNVYVDNVIVGADSHDICFQIYTEGKHIFQKAAMNLREWVSNSAVFASIVPPHDKAKGEIHKVLGLQWDTESDTLTTNTPNILKDHILTKRRVLHELASIFDPLGYFNPLVVSGKIFLQNLRRDKISWDQPIEGKLEENWQRIVQDFQLIPTLRIRGKIAVNVFFSEASTTCSLIGFADASPNVYGAAIYLKTK